MDKGEYRPQDNTIYLKCLLRLTRDVTLVEMREYNGEPEQIILKKETNVSLADGRLTFCATTEGCDSGPLVKIEETRGIKIADRYIGRTVVIPAKFLELHPNVL